MKEFLIKLCLQCKLIIGFLFGAILAGCFKLPFMMIILIAIGMAVTFHHKGIKHHIGLIIQSIRGIFKK